MSTEILSTCLLVPGLSSTACAAWVQAWGSIGAILAAIGVVYWQHHLGIKREDARTRNARRGHLSAIEAELRHCDMQCSIFLAGWREQKLAGVDIYAPAYRLPTIAYEHSLPPLTAEGTLNPEEFGKLVQFYVDAISFNRCLDNLDRMQIEGQGVMHGGQIDNFKKESRRAATKALHVVSQSDPIRGKFQEDMRSLASRLEPALAVIASQLAKLNK